MMSDTGSTIHDDVVRRWRAAGECGDANATVGCLSPDVELLSPLTDGFRFRGRDQVVALLAVTFSAISDIRYHTELADDDTRALFYRGRIRGHTFDVTQLLRFDADALIREVTMFGRP